MHTVEVIASLQTSLEDINSVRRRRNRYGYSNHYAHAYQHVDVGGYSYYYMPAPITAAFGSLPGDASREGMSIVVDEPGIYELPSMIKKSAKNFRYVFFPEAGKFSLVRIYKYMRGTGQKFIGKGIYMDRLPKLLSCPKIDQENAHVTTDNSELATIMQSEFKKVMPYGVETEAEIKKSAAFKAIQKEIKNFDFIELPKRAVKKGRKVLEAAPEKADDKYAKYTVLHNRYIPVIVQAYSVTSGDWGSQKNYIYYLGANRKLVSATKFVLPAIKGSDQLAVNLFIHLESHSHSMFAVGRPSFMKDNHTGSYEAVLHILAYDIETGAFVRSDQLAEEAHTLMQARLVENKKAYNAHTRELLSKEAGPVFKRKINDYLAARGFPGFKITEAVGIRFKDSAQIHDWVKDKNSYGVGKMGTHFNIAISYHGSNIVGVRGSQRGYVVVFEDEDGNMRMQQSAWCQRVSKWTKATGRVDQKNGDWLLEDWLAGPFAERCNLQITEAPIVFFGNKSKKKDRKAAVLNKMRAMQGR